MASCKRREQGERAGGKRKRKSRQILSVKTGLDEIAILKLQEDGTRSNMMLRGRWVQWEKVDELHKTLEEFIPSQAFGLGSRV
jgi:hypothetical protein